MRAALRLSSLRAGASILATVLAAACAFPGLGPYEDLADELERNRRLWSSTGIDHYQVNLRRICFCHPDATRERVVHVRGGTIVSVVDAETGEAAPEELLSLYVDVEGLFDIVEDAIHRDAAELTVRFDPELGYPVEIRIDYDYRMADEEVTFEATGLHPLR